MKYFGEWFIITEIIGSKWNLFIIGVLSDGPKRFTELRRKIYTANSKTITNHLKFLEKYDIVRRTVYAEVPPRVEYELTDLGKDFVPTLRDIAEWGKSILLRTERITIENKQKISSRDISLNGD